MMSTGTDALSSAARILQAQAMPAEEIPAVIGAADAETVHRFLELHRERLQERLAEQCLLLIDLERSLMERWIGGEGGGVPETVLCLHD
jgi:ABC-type Fe2+-enterobactin transport system substrate-binding protein